MEERSKTNKEIFEEKYPSKKLSLSPMICVEAIGYLKALREYFPSEKKWVDSYITALRAVLLFYTL